MASYIQDTNNGLFIADTQSILADVQKEFKTALGDTLNLNSNTPQGLLISGEVIARSGVMRNNADLANQINPDVAGGVFLDAIMGFMGIQRRGNSPTLVQGVILTGTPGRLITAGSRCASSSNAVFRLQSDVTLDVSGSAIAIFQSEEFGNIKIGVLPQVWKIMDSVIGWDTATAPINAAVIPGALRMSDGEGRIYRRNELGNLGYQSVRAAKAKVSKVPGVLSMSIRENVAGVAQTIDGVQFSRGNALWCCVDGGTDLTVANALLDSKACGAPFDSGTSSGTPVLVVVTEPASGQPYEVRFTRPDPLDGIEVWTRAYVKQTTTVSNPQTASSDAILAWAAGMHPNEAGLVVGQSFSAFEVAGAIAVGVPGLYVRSCEVSRDNVNWTTVIPMALWEKAKLLRGNIRIILE